ncbi:MAG TPA: 3-oxoacyl-[acyl-carrier-protein] synthase III C-terminal domain-containing protein [Pseudonocardiaceae bacterium]
MTTPITPAASGTRTMPAAAGPGPATATIAGVGTALPGAAVDQGALWDGFFDRHFHGSRAAGRVFAAAGVRSRHAVVNPLVEDVSGWSTQRRMLRYAEEAHPLGHRAVTAALAAAGLPASAVRQLVVVTCTGYATPGLDVSVAGSLGLPGDAQRLLVGHMGCYAALPALGAAADFVVARGGPVVLLCLELTSLHVQPAGGDLGQVVSHALFGDAAVAVVLTPGPVPGRPQVSDTVAHTDLTASAQMTWDVTDLGFRMGLSPDVPGVLARHVGPAVGRLLGRHGLTTADVGGWAVHPGGPAILDTVERGLALPPEALAASRSVLARRGNCSSPTVLLVLDELLAAGAGRDGRPLVALAFGPGLTLYATLLTSGPPARPAP